MCTARKTQATRWVSHMHGIVGVADAVVFDLEAQTTVLGELAVVKNRKVQNHTEFGCSTLGHLNHSLFAEATSTTSVFDSDSEVNFGRQAIDRLWDHDVGGSEGLTRNVANIMGHLQHGVK